MFDRFSEEAIRVLVHAQEEARRLKHVHVGCEHLLLGLMAVGKGKVHDCMRSNNLNLETVRAEVEKLTTRGRKASPKDLPFSAASKQSLERAFRECLHAKQQVILPEHLLLGLLTLHGEPENLVSQVLENLGIDRHELRQQLWLGILSEIKGSAFSQPEVVLSMSQCPEILMSAVAETYKLKRSEIGADAIFLSLLCAGGKLVCLLEDFGISYEFARAEVSKVAVTGGMVIIQMKFTKCAEQLMRIAREEASGLGHTSVDARHICLAFTHEHEGVVWQIFREKNVDIEALRAAVLALFEETR